MNTISVHTSRNYQILVGDGLLTHMGEYAARTVSGRNAVIVSDRNVWNLYGDICRDSLINSGFHVTFYTFSPGEESKSFVTYLNILNVLANNHTTRSDLLIALGGGVTGDLTGFAAATYLRGISYIQIPTSLLAMVDSSVGGKTAIDLPAGKNLVGAFYQPSLVICDTTVLSTLPAPIFRDGCAEINKYGILFDAYLFRHLENYNTSFSTENVICRCIQLKRDIVEQDEFDCNTRQLLNLGHTIGHAIEAYSDFSVSHGSAVAIGTAIITRSAISLGICDTDDGKRIVDLLESFHLPISTDIKAEKLYPYILSDKKHNGNATSFIFPEKIGRCSIKSIPDAGLERIIKAGL